MTNNPIIKYYKCNKNLRPISGWSSYKFICLLVYSIIGLFIIPFIGLFPANAGSMSNDDYQLQLQDIDQQAINDPNNNQDKQTNSTQQSSSQYIGQNYKLLEG